MTQTDSFKQKRYIAMTKSQLAICAKVSRQTFAKWLKHPKHVEAFAEMGVTSKNRALPPMAVKYIVETFCIDVD